MEVKEDNTPLPVILKASGLIGRLEGRVRLEKRLSAFSGAVMTEHATWAEVLAPVIAFFGKLFPPLLGAIIVIAVDPPKTRKELFLRFFVGLTFSYMFGRVFFDFLKSFGWFGFLDWGNYEHMSAVLGFLGGCGWFIMGGGTQLLRKFRNDPLTTISDTKKVGS